MIDIGFIGLGTMGRPMAGHLQAAGHHLFLHDVGPIAPELIAAGGIVCQSGREVAEQSDAVIIMVPDTPHVEAVLFGADGVAEGLSKGQIVVDMSSISPLATKIRREDRGARRRLSRCACVRRRSRRQSGQPDHHGWRSGARVQNHEAGVRQDGQERHPRRRQW
jgi:UDP-N-acetyl-D-mannosaminuronate dehydrogenase